MPTLATFISFAFVALVMIFTPGPGMIYYVSRSICQGRKAGLISLAGGLTGVLVYMLGAALGITALIFAVPHAYDVLRFLGAVYLLYIAWQAIKPNGRSPFQVRQLPLESPRKFYSMGFGIALLNPKIAIMYLSLLPQFIDLQRGSALTQALALGFFHIFLSILGNGLIVMTAGMVAKFLAENPKWLLAQRWVMGATLIGIAIHMAITH